MSEEEGAGRQPNTIPKKFFRGIKSIANFLKLTPEKARKLIREGTIPAKKDETVRWVLVNVDYYQSLQG